MISKHMLLVFMLVMGLQTAAQTYSRTDVKIINAAVSNYREDQTDKLLVSINSKTTNKLFKSFDYLHPNKYAIDTTRLKLNKDWKLFLALVDTSRIGNDHINVPAIRFNNKNIKVSNSKPDRVFNFSSQIISTDGNKAVFAYTDYGGPEDSAGYIVLLEKKGDRWQVLAKIMLYIS